ncbi:MAG: 4-hydroxythreonine-4-phosphate dehydrogenase PdxA [Calditrichaeota bacterium]|nr:MAG: 4-hydroxythreonine-4-phosphate dehydrogenase PdxA [Calditrichota bacterium]
MSRSPVQIGITIGDINGIGPEVIIKSLLKLPRAARVNFQIIGSRQSLDFWSTKVKNTSWESLIKENGINAKIVEPSRLPGPVFNLRHPTENSGKIAALSIVRAAELASENKIDAIVTSPISKYAIQEAGFNFPGHTEFLAHLAGDKLPVMLMIAGKIRIAVATTHIPIKDVAAQLSVEMLCQKVKILQRELVLRFKINNPQIVLTSLNPHAGEGGKIGDEEIEVIGKAVTKLKAEGVAVLGPFPADALFSRGAENSAYDACMTMYHDQGLIPFKIFSRGRGVNYTCGLPFIRTSPDHGTAYDIAGQNRADESSMMEAIRVAISLGATNKTSR